VGVPTFRSEPAVERFYEGVIGRLAWSREVERGAALVRPQIQIARHKLGALVAPDRGRQPHLSPDSFQHLDDIGAAEGKAQLQRRREPENVSTIMRTRSLRPVAN
jgi:hypothetical protein